MRKSIRSWEKILSNFGFLFGKNRKGLRSSHGNAHFHRRLRMEAMEERQMLSIAPTIESLSVEPWPTMDRGSDITLTANNVQAYEGRDVVSVSFYYDSNRNGHLESGTDQPLGLPDTYGGDGWSVDVSNSFLPNGVH
jgi:hypothetical protein